MPNWQPMAYKEYLWIVADPDLLGGKLAVRGTRISLSMILECLANSMTLADINQSYDHVLTQEALSEVLQVASELTESFHGCLTPTLLGSTYDWANPPIAQVPSEPGHL